MPDQVDWRAIEREATPGRAVGRLLRDQREVRGLTVADIEKRLRIRRNFVEALESGRFDQLPGAAYIPAFLRAYASHVGLDPQKVLSAYQLSCPVPIKRPVALPADFPMIEKRAPVGLAVLAALVVGAGYSVWHYLPHPQTVVAEKVPPVPDRLLATMPASNEKSTASTASVSPSVSSPAPQQVPTATARAVTTPPTVARTEPPSLSAGPQPAPPIVITVPAPPPSVVLSAPSFGQAQAAPLAEPQESRAAPEASALPQIPPVTQSTGIPTRIDTPLVMRSNSWVELRAPSGDVLAMTYVRAGETYTVPAGISYRILDAR